MSLERELLDLALKELDALGAKTVPTQIRNALSERPVGRPSAQEVALFLRPLTGYVENGSEQSVTIFQDDATREWIVRAGRREYWTSSLPDSLAKAVADAAPERL